MDGAVERDGKPGGAAEGKDEMFKDIQDESNEKREKKKTKKKNDSDMTDDVAAVKIQAAVRGKAERKKQKVIELILSQEGVDDDRGSLVQLNLKQLRRRAKEAGVDKDALAKAAPKSSKKKAQAKAKVRVFSRTCVL